MRACVLAVFDGILRVDARQALGDGAEHRLRRHPHRSVRSNPGAFCIGDLQLPDCFCLCHVTYLDDFKLRLRFGAVVDIVAQDSSFRRSWAARTVCSSTSSTRTWRPTSRSPFATSSSLTRIRNMRICDIEFAVFLGSIRRIIWVDDELRCLRVRCSRQMTNFHQPLS